MQLNDLQLQKYNKVSTLAHTPPTLFSSLTLLNPSHSLPDTHSFSILNTDHANQLHMTRLAARAQVLDKIIYLREGPKILYLSSENESVVIEEQVTARLDEYMIDNEENTREPYLAEEQARAVMRDVNVGIRNYEECRLGYDCMSVRNVVMDGRGRWGLSAVGVLLGVDRHNEKSLVYELGCLLFRMVVGFDPRGEAVLQGFKLTEYVRYLHAEKKQRLLKVYHYCERLLELSQTCLALLQSALSGFMALQHWYEHQFFTRQTVPKPRLDSKTRDIRIINSVQQAHYSLIMSAIEYRKTHPEQRLNQRQLPSPSEPTFSQVLASLQRHPYFKYIKIDQNVQTKLRSSILRHVEEQSTIPIEGQYFYGTGFDPQHDYPCRQLIKLIDREREQHPHKFQAGEYEAQLKLYAYPYAVAYELVKVQAQHPLPIRRKLTRAVALLLSVSSLHRVPTLQPLHHTTPLTSTYEQLKPLYRESINQLYQYFLNQAMRKYNSKGEGLSNAEKIRKKEQGLQCYRLCLKLLEASLVVRKQGADLNLERIETGQRKDIENDLSVLLGKYFPRRPELI